MSIVSASRGGTVLAPNNVLARHAAEANTVALWQLDGDLIDSGPNSLDLAEVGTLPYELVGAPGVIAGRASEPTLTNHGSLAYDALLDLKGAFTAMAMIRPSSFDSGSPWLSFGVPFSELEADNYQYLLNIVASGKLEYIAEFGAGSDALFTSTGAALTLGEWNHAAITRDGSGVVNTYVDGANTGTSGVLTAPTGGTNAVLRIGTSGASDLEGYLGSVHLLDRVLSGAEILAEANRLLPSWQG